MEGSARGRARAHGSSDEPLRGRLRALALQPNRTRRASGIACNALARWASRGRPAEIGAADIAIACLNLSTRCTSGSRAMLWSPCARCALQSRAAKQTEAQRRPLSPPSTTSSGRGQSGQCSGDGAVRSDVATAPPRPVERMVVTTTRGNVAPVKREHPLTAIEMAKRAHGWPHHEPSRRAASAAGPRSRADRIDALLSADAGSEASADDYIKPMHEASERRRRGTTAGRGSAAPSSARLPPPRGGGGGTSQLAAQRSGPTRPNPKRETGGGGTWLTRTAAARETRRDRDLARL